MGAIAFLSLVAAIVLGWSALIPVSATLAGGLYGAELAYWSREERTRWHGDPGAGLRRTALVALLGAGAFMVAALLLALVDTVRARGLALDLLGAVAAVTVVATVLVAARGRQPGGSA